MRPKIILKPSILKENVLSTEVQSLNESEKETEENESEEEKEKVAEMVVSEYFAPKISNFDRKNLRSFTEKSQNLASQLSFQKKPKQKLLIDEIDLIEEFGNNKIVIRSIKPLTTRHDDLSSPSYSKDLREHNFSRNNSGSSNSRASFMRSNFRSQTTSLQKQQTLRSSPTKSENDSKRLTLNRLQTGIEHTRSLSELIQIELVKKAKAMGALINESIKKSQERKNQIEVQTTEMLQKQFQETMQKLDTAEYNRKKMSDDKEKQKLHKEEIYVKKLTKMKTLKEEKELERQKSIQEIIEAKTEAFENKRRSLEEEKDRKISERRRDYEFSKMFSSVLKSMTTVPLSVVKEDEK